MGQIWRHVEGDGGTIRVLKFGIRLKGRRQKGRRTKGRPQKIVRQMIAT